MGDHGGGGIIYVKADWINLSGDGAKLEADGKEGHN
jgi:hypothetical protein